MKSPDGSLWGIKGMGIKRVSMVISNVHISIQVAYFYSLQLVDKWDISSTNVLKRTK